jgi:hypothetical protein
MREIVFLLGANRLAMGHWNGVYYCLGPHNDTNTQEYGRLGDSSTFLGRHRYHARDCISSESKLTGNGALKQSLVLFRLPCTVSLKLLLHLVPLTRH